MVFIRPLCHAIDRVTSSCSHSRSWCLNTELSRSNAQTLAKPWLNPDQGLVVFISRVYYARKRSTCPFDPRCGFRQTLSMTYIPLISVEPRCELASQQMPPTLLRVYTGFGRVQDVFSLLRVRVKLVSRVHSMTDCFRKKAINQEL